MSNTVDQIGEPEGEAAEAKHTPEPWRYVDESTPAEVEMGLPNFAIETADGAFGVASLIHSEADARRICAVVNACKGIRIEALEQNAIRRLVQAIDGLLAFIGHGHDDEPAVYIARAARATVGGEAPQGVKP